MQISRNRDRADRRLRNEVKPLVPGTPRTVNVARDQQPSRRIAVRSRLPIRPHPKPGEQNRPNRRRVNNRLRPPTLVPVTQPRNEPSEKSGQPRIAQLDVEFLLRRASLLRGRLRFDRPLLRRRFAHFLPFRSCRFANFSPRARPTRRSPPIIITLFSRDGRAAPDARSKIAPSRPKTDKNARPARRRRALSADYNEYNAKFC